MECKKCGSNNVKIDTSSFAKSKRRSFLWNLFMIFCTGGLWLLWMMLRKRKEKIVTQTWATCQDCGNRWEIKK